MLNKNISVILVNKKKLTIDSLEEGKLYPRDFLDNIGLELHRVSDDCGIFMFKSMNPNIKGFFSFNISKGGNFIFIERIQRKKKD